jgi:hypothetical protein
MRVANLSLGWDRNPGDTFKAAFDSAWSAGLVTVAAAGNSGTPRGKGKTVIYPAIYESVIAVAAIDDAYQRASFSSTGDEVELAAPGVLVYSTWNDDTGYYDPPPVCGTDAIGQDGCYKYGSGTSMASPHVAGTAALVIAANPGWTNEQVRTRLVSTANDLGTPGWDPQYGYGLVDAAEAALSGTSPEDDLGPVTSGVSVDPNPTGGAASVALSADISDATTGNSTIAEAEYFVGTVGTDGSGIPMEAADGGFGSATESVVAGLDVSGWAVGEYALYVHGRDAIGNWGAPAVAVLFVTDASSNILIVDSITFSTKTAGPNTFLYTTVTVAGGDGGPLGGASVRMVLTWDQEGDGNPEGSWDLAGETGPDGTVTFTLAKAPGGQYLATVTDLSHTDYTWDSAAGVTSASYDL